MDNIIRTENDDYYGADRKELIQFLEWRQGGCDTVRMVTNERERLKREGAL